MSDDVRLIDTNILVHAYTIADDRKHQIARGLLEAVWQGEEACTTLQNLCEFFLVVTKKVSRPMPIAAAERVVEGILRSTRWRVIDREPEALLRAIEWVKTRRVPFWDALIAAAMIAHGVSVILTENERDFARIPGLTVINPFRARLRQ